MCTRVNKYLKSLSFFLSLFFLVSDLIVKSLTLKRSLILFYFIDRYKTYSRQLYILNALKYPQNLWLLPWFAKISGMGMIIISSLNFRYDDLKYVVIVGNADYVDREWDTLEMLPKILVLHGSPMSRLILYN